MWKMTTAVTTCLLLVSNSPAEEGATTELKQLEGTWQLAYRVVDGKETAASKLKKVTVIIDADGSWKLRSRGHSLLSGRLKLDPSQAPKAADWTVVAGGEVQEDQQGLAIYELDGDTFRHCYSTKRRPSTFESKAGSGATYAVFKRAKEE